MARLLIISQVTTWRTLIFLLIERTGNSPSVTLDELTAKRINIVNAEAIFHSATEVSSSSYIVQAKSPSPKNL